MTRSQVLYFLCMARSAAEVVDVRVVVLHYEYRNTKSTDINILQQTGKWECLMRDPDRAVTLAGHAGFLII